MTVYAPNIAPELARLPLVKHVGIASLSVNAFPAKHGQPTFPKPLDTDRLEHGSLVGEYFSEDRVALVAGHMPDPSKANQFMADTLAAKAMGWHVGEYVRFYFYTDAQATYRRSACTQSRR